MNVNRSNEWKWFIYCYPCKAMIHSPDDDTYFFDIGQWNLAKRYIGTILIHNPPWLCSMNVNRSNERKWFIYCYLCKAMIHSPDDDTYFFDMNVNRSNERKWFHIKNGKQQKIFRRNY